MIIVILHQVIYLYLMANKETRTIRSSQSYWLTEYKQSIKTGDYPDVPIRLYEGFLMISYLRYLRDTNLIRRYSWHTQNAIQRKLMQYEGVEWFYSCPTRKPRKPFNYIRQIYKYDHKEEDVTSLKSKSQSRYPSSLL